MQKKGLVNLKISQRMYRGLTKERRRKNSVKSISKIRESFKWLNHDQIYWGQVKPLQDVMLIENDWPKEKLNLANYQLFSMLSSSVQVHLNIKVTVDQERKQGIKLV